MFPKQVGGLCERKKITNLPSDIRLTKKCKLVSFLYESVTITSTPFSVLSSLIVYSVFSNFSDKNDNSPFSFLFWCITKSFQRWSLLSRTKNVKRSSLGADKKNRVTAACHWSLRSWIQSEQFQCSWYLSPHQNSFPVLICPLSTMTSTIDKGIQSGLSSHENHFHLCTKPTEFIPKVPAQNIVGKSVPIHEFTRWGKGLSLTLGLGRVTKLVIEGFRVKFSNQAGGFEMRNSHLVSNFRAIDDFVSSWKKKRRHGPVWIFLWQDETGYSLSCLVLSWCLFLTTDSTYFRSWV